MRWPKLLPSLVCLLAACGDGTDPDELDPTGLWDASISGFELGFPSSCRVDWVMSITANDPHGGIPYSTFLPQGVPVRCGDEDQAPWALALHGYGIRVVGDSLRFLDPDGEVFLAARLGEDAMQGEARTIYPGASFTAERHVGSRDPNLSPVLLVASAEYPDVEVGDSVRVVARVEDGYASLVSGVPVQWSSSDPTIAEMDDDDDFLHGLAPGQTIVTATAEGLEGATDVTVLQPAASVVVTDAPDSLIIPESYEVLAEARDELGGTYEGRRFYWTSSDTTVATVTPYGATAWVNPLAPGSVTITARSATLTAQATFPVLPAVADVEIDPPDSTVLIGETIQLSATLRDSEGNVLTGRPVIWEAAGAFTVDGNGLARARTGGPGSVWAIAENAGVERRLVGLMDAPIATLAGGLNHTCAITEAGTVYCWGNGSVGQLGQDVPGPSPAVPIPLGRAAASIASRGQHTCALDEAGAALCWGKNTSGQLGQAGGAEGEVLEVSGGLSFTALAGGEHFTCGVTAARDAWCWGDNTFGQLGRGTTGEGINATPQMVTGDHEFVAVAAGYQHACGLTPTGEAWCWGANYTGALGLGMFDDQLRPTPVRAAAPLTFTALTTSYDATCGISTAGPVYCWGGDDDEMTPAPVDASTGYAALAAGHQIVCRLSEAGALSCFRAPENLGLEFTPSEPIASFTTGLAFVCAKPVTGRSFCWGVNDSGQLGRVDGSPPVEIAGQP